MSKHILCVRCPHTLVSHPRGGKCVRCGCQKYLARVGAEEKRVYEHGVYRKKIQRGRTRNKREPLGYVRDKNGLVEEIR